MDNRHMEIRKALDSLSNGGNYLIPQYLSAIVSEQVQIRPSLRNIIKREEAPGGFYNWVNWNIEPLGIPQGGMVPDSAVLSFANTDPVETKFQIETSILAAPFQISNFEIAATKGLLDLVARRINSGINDFFRLEEKFFLFGDMTNNNTQPGLLATLAASGNASAGTTFAGTGATLNYGLFGGMENAQEDLGYSVDCWVVTSNIYAIIKQAAFNHVRLIGLEEAAIGFSMNAEKDVLMLGGIPVVRSHYLYNGNDNILGLSLNPEALVVAELQAPGVEEKASLPTQDARVFLAKSYEGLAVRQPYMHSYARNVSLTGVTPATFVA